MIANGYLVDWPDSFERPEFVGPRARNSKSLPTAGLTPQDGTAIGQAHIRTEIILPLANSVTRETSETVEA